MILVLGGRSALGGEGVRHHDALNRLENCPRWYAAAKGHSALGSVLIPSIDGIRFAVARTVPPYDVKEAYLYGSYVRGEQTEQSDIDLRLLCGREITLAELLDIQESLGRV